MFGFSVFLFITVLLASCSLISGLGNKVSRQEAASSIGSFELPMTIHPHKALVIVISTYLIDVMGGGPSVEVAFTKDNSTPDRFAELVPIGDFICGYAKPGNNTVFAQWQYGRPNNTLVSENFIFETGKVSYIEAETISYKNTSIKIYQISKEEGIYYVQKAVNRLNNNHPIVIKNEEQARFNELVVKRSKEKLREKTQCAWVFK